MNNLEKITSMSYPEYKMIEDRWKKHLDYIASRINMLYSSIGNKTLIDKFLNYYQQSNGNLYNKLNDLFSQYNIMLSYSSNSKVNAIIQEITQEIQIYENLKNKLEEITFSPEKRYNFSDMIKKYIQENNIKNFNLVKDFPKLFFWISRKNNLNTQEIKVGLDTYILKREQMYYSLFNLVELSIDLVKQVSSNKK
ncbi:MAG: hypothetical protein QW210_01155 [Candidatus Woesearchaeota archaeon]